MYGGSQVFDPGRGEAMHWPRLTDTELENETHQNVRIINAGIPGHVSFDSLGRFFSEGHQYEPDFVILDNAWNDIKRFNEDRSLLRTLEPYRKSEDYRYYRNFIDRYLSYYSQFYVRLTLFQRPSNRRSQTQFGLSVP